MPSTKWKKNTLGRGWVLGETLITGIGQGYIQTTPLQLCLMTAQLANGGFKIYPKITVNEQQDSFETIKNKISKKIIKKKKINLVYLKKEKNFLNLPQMSMNHFLETKKILNLF